MGVCLRGRARNLSSSWRCQLTDDLLRSRHAVGTSVTTYDVGMVYLSEKQADNHVIDPSSYSAEHDHLTVEVREDGVVVVTLDNQEIRNAMGAQMTASFGRLINEIRDDSRPKCLLITGAGSAFCSGGDKTWLEEEDHSPDDFRNKMMPFYRTWLGVTALEIPVIAAVNGAAVGAGAILALAADIRIGSPRAKFCLPFLTLGMAPALGGSFLVKDVVGMAVARDLIYTGRMIDAKRMYELNIITELIEGDDFRGAAVDFASDIASRAPIATRLMKAGLLNNGPASLEDALQWEGVAQATTLATEDIIEGYRASKERRKPNFKGV